MLKIDIITLFPKMFEGPFGESILKRAQDKKLIEVNIYNLRDWSNDKYKSVDDKPYGGGAGMIIRVDIIENALKSIKAKPKTKNSKIILLDAGGKKFTQKIAHNYSKLKRLVLICGHYEGFDERVRKLVDEEISIGDYVLTGGELPAMVITDTITRLIPGVIEAASLEEESFNQSLLECPQYTRPKVYKKMKVPAVLLSGNHAKIKTWREQEAWKKTKRLRVDLLKSTKLHQ
ncbi:MAG: tRNA (guanosine(37)-N1)-methyltransferase TrmD [Patescibacteria group bacterium]|nr:tRNA (guanosine(37)-N1)-methyltransferase TrmD [Patescibacteria group bacterium]